MQFAPNSLYHSYNRGNNQQLLFFSYANYLFFLKKIRDYVLPHADLLAYCLMPNHFHLMLETKPDLEEQALNAGIQRLLSSYTQAINKQEKRTGSLFQQHTKAKCLVEPEHALTCFHYLHQNPLRAGLVRQMENWPFSSFKDYCGFRNGTICNQSRTRLLLDLPENHLHFYETSHQVLRDDYFALLF